MFKHISGKQKGSARCRPYIPSLMPEERKIRNDIYPKSITDTIEKFHRDHNATSPNVKDDVKLKIGNRQYLKSRVIYRFETWAELWNTFQKFQAVIASIIANPEKPEFHLYSEHQLPGICKKEQTHDVSAQLVKILSKYAEGK